MLLDETKEFPGAGRLTLDPLEDLRALFCSETGEFHDLCRRSPGDKSILDMFLKGNKVVGVIPGFFAAGNIATGDIIKCIDGLNVPKYDNSEVVIEALKATRDAIGSRLPLIVARNGEEIEVILV